MGLWGSKPRAKKPTARLKEQKNQERETTIFWEEDNRRLTLTTQDSEDEVEVVVARQKEQVRP
ncbi:GD24792 [Drosophila simulans]|uniref:GD24792 n=1 Tax=Drosophila simulans TaxID=7240 RepID=B4NUB5_DROSI|nr:GD24792 [Drosophila simulans]